MLRKILRPFAFVIALFCSQAAYARQCVTVGPRYQLEGDTVQWRMDIRRNEDCVRGVRLSYVYNATVSVASTPRFGSVAIIGSGFSYIAKSNFHGEDSFVVNVSGYKSKMRGFSNIRVVVSVGDDPARRAAAFAHFEPNESRD
jgi:hypothetical protein